MTAVHGLLGRGLMFAGALVGLTWAASPAHGTATLSLSGSAPTPGVGLFDTGTEVQAGSQVVPDFYDIYNTSGLPVSRSVNLNIGTQTVLTGFASARAGDGTAQLVANGSTVVNIRSSNPIYQAQASLATQYNDTFVLDTTTLPAGTPEQFLLTATVSNSFTGGHALAQPTIFCAKLFPLFTVYNSLSMFPSNSPPSGTYTDTLSFHAGDSVFINVTFSGSSFATSAGLSSNGSCSVNSSLSVSFTPITSGATFTSVLAESNLPEPAGLAGQALMGGILLRRRRIASK